MKIKFPIVKKFKFSLHITAIFLFLSLNAFATPAGDNILLSEVGYHNTANDPGAEWFELFNPTASAIDISGWTITDGEGVVTVPATTIIASGAYFIGAHTTATFNSLHPGVIVDLEYGPIDVGSIALANSGDELTLADDMASIVDFVSWEGHTVGWNNPIANSGETIVRVSITDTDLEGDWLSNQVPSPATGNLVALAPVPASIPTLSEWALYVLILLLGFVLFQQSRLIRD